MINNLWQQAMSAAEQTPPERNRYVDLLRAFSISVVVLGHWLMAAPSWVDGGARLDHLFAIEPWTRWLTWMFQVMPVFFFVGGFSNGVSWDSAKRKQQSYATWLEARLRRLLGPTIPLVLLWTTLGIAAHYLGVSSTVLGYGSQISLVPVWFLAIYFFIVMLVPVSRYLWHRFGFYSVIVPILCAVLGDWVFFNSSVQWFPWFNYLFVWSAIHQLGYAWHQERLENPLLLITIFILAMASLVYVTQFGPYPTSLVGFAGQEMSNTTPPKLPIVALGLSQISLLLLLEKPARRLLAKTKAWASTVLINGLIMPIFLWHSTVMMLVIGLTLWLAPTWLATEVVSTAWWATRPAWIAVYLLVMLVSLPLFLKIEQLVSAQPKGKSVLLIVMSAGILICGGLAFLAGGGVVGTGALGLNWPVIALPMAGVALLSGVGRIFR